MSRLRSSALGRYVGFGLIGAIWALGLTIVGFFVCAFFVYSDLKAPAKSHWTRNSWLEVVAFEIFADNYTAMWQGQNDCVDFDPLLIYVPKPGVGHLRGPEFDTTIHMAPGRVRVQPPASPDARFVVVTGDSYAMGWGVEDNETFSYLLQEKYGYHTVNTGVSSYATARELTRLRRMGLLTRIDALVIQYCDNDLPENETYAKNPNQFFEERDPHKVWALLQAYRQNRISYWHTVRTFLAIVHQAIIDHGTYLGLKAVVTQTPVPFGHTLRRKGDQGERIARAFLAVFDQFPELKDTPVIVTEMSPRAGYSGFTDALREPANARPNLIPVDLNYTPADFFRFDLHLNAHGHRTAADQLAVILKQVLATRKPVPGAAASHPGY